MAVELGTGFVRLVPTMQGFAAKAGREMNAGLVGPAAVAGKKAGGAASSGIVSGLSKVKGKLGGVAASATGAVAGFFAFQKVTGYIGDSVNAASSLNETMNRSSVIFGAQHRSMLNWASGAAQAFGLSKNAALGTAATFGDMFQQIGFGTGEAVKMSKSVIQLSADLGSFNDLPTAEVADMISSAFRGEYDSLQRLIPNINAARVESVALAKTGKPTAKALTAQEKAAAVLAIVQKDGARAAGDFAKTQDSVANAAKRNEAASEDLKAKLGQALLPVMSAIQKVGNGLLSWALKNTGTLKVLAIVVGGALTAAFVAWGASVIAATWPLLAIGAAVGLVIAGLVALWKRSQTFRTIVKGVFSFVGTVFRTFFNVAKSIFSAVANFIRGAVTRIISVVRWFGRIPGIIRNALAAGYNWVKNILGRIASFVGRITGKIGGFFSGMWDGLVSAGKWAVNGVISLINNIIDGINWAIGGLNSINPFGSIGKIGHIPMLASGGIVTSATLAMVGEGSEPEAVLPLSKLQAMMNAPRAQTAAPTIVISAHGLNRGLEQWLTHAVKVRGGGDVQKAFGASRYAYT